jgi:hypothetical protein
MRHLNGTLNLIARPRNLLRAAASMTLRRRWEYHIAPGGKVELSRRPPGKNGTAPEIRHSTEKTSKTFPGLRIGNASAMLEPWFSS